MRDSSLDEFFGSDAGTAAGDCDVDGDADGADDGGGDADGADDGGGDADGADDGDVDGDVEDVGGAVEDADGDAGDVATGAGSGAADGAVDAGEDDEGDAPADADGDPCVDGSDGAADVPVSVGSVEPVVATSRWEPTGGGCPACGAAVERRWYEPDADAYVCRACKDW